MLVRLRRGVGARIPLCCEVRVLWVGCGGNNGMRRALFHHFCVDETALIGHNHPPPSTARMPWSVVRCNLVPCPLGMLHVFRGVSVHAHSCDVCRCRLAQDLARLVGRAASALSLHFISVAIRVRPLGAASFFTFACACGPIQAGSAQHGRSCARGSGRVVRLQAWGHSSILWWPRLVVEEGLGAWPMPTVCVCHWLRCRLGDSFRRHSAAIAAHAALLLHVAHAASTTHDGSQLGRPLGQTTRGTWRFWAVCLFALSVVASYGRVIGGAWLHTTLGRFKPRLGQGRP